MANTGLSFKRLGFDPILIGCVGEDRLGSIIRNIIEEEGVSSRFIIGYPELAASYTIVPDPPDTDLVFLYHPGSNDHFSAIRSTLFHFGYPPLMRRMYMDDGRHLAAMFEQAKKVDCVTSLDMAHPDSNSESGGIAWLKLLKHTLPHVDIFLPSLEELLFMLDREQHNALKRGEN